MDKNRLQLAKYWMEEARETGERQTIKETT